MPSPSFAPESPSHQPSDTKPENKDSGNNGGWVPPNVLLAFFEKLFGTMGTAPCYHLCVFEALMHGIADV
jgi:hypothetical protein